MTDTIADGIVRIPRSDDVIIHHSACSELSVWIQQLQQTTRSDDESGFKELVRVLYDINNGNGMFVESGIQAALEKHYKYLRK